MSSKSTKIYSSSSLFKSLANKTGDVTFLFGDEQNVNAFKDILASVSSVFKAMFFGDLKKISHIKVLNISYNGFSNMIKLIHGYEINELIPKKVKKCIQSKCKAIFHDELHIQLNESPLMAILSMKWLNILEMDLIIGISKWIATELECEGLEVNRLNKQQRFVPFKPFVRFSGLTLNELMKHNILIAKHLQAAAQTY